MEKPEVKDHIQAMRERVDRLNKIIEEAEKTGELPRHRFILALFTDDKEDPNKNDCEIMNGSYCTGQDDVMMMINLMSRLPAEVAVFIFQQLFTEEKS